MITRGNLFANIRTIARVLGVDASSRLFNDMLLAHADGLVQGPLMALATGAALIRAGDFSVPGMEDWLNVVRREGATHFTSVPTVWTLIDRYARHDDYFAAPEVRILSSVAAALDPALWARLEARFGRRLVNQYGLTETVTSALYAGPHEEAGAFGTIGRPVDCEARIEAVEGGTSVGELQLRGANVFPGYWRNAERHAGDVHRRRLDEDGRPREAPRGRKLRDPGPPEDRHHAGRIPDPSGGD